MEVAEDRQLVVGDAEADELAWIEERVRGKCEARGMREIVHAALTVASTCSRVAGRAWRARDGSTRTSLACSPSWPG